MGKQSQTVSLTSLGEQLVVDVMLSGGEFGENCWKITGRQWMVDQLRIFTNRHDARLNRLGYWNEVRRIAEDFEVVRYSRA